MGAVNPGEMLQIDHMTLDLLGKVFKQFTALCPLTKITVAQVYTNATSTTPTDFLYELRTYLPFDLSSIQVYRRSEFMAVFEKSCEKLGIPLQVLPPKRP